MEMKSFEKLLNMLPDGEKKSQLMAKYRTLAKKRERTSGGLHDEFSLEPTGHIMIEEIDKSGEVVGVLADQPNLVVNGAEEIIMRSFSGDPKRMLFKNRIPVGGTSPLYHTPLEAPLADVVSGQDTVVYPANELWKEVDDRDFEIEYSYYPITVYLTSEASLEPGKRAFKVHSGTSIPAGAAPLTAETYSTSTGLFIGLGEGLNKPLGLNDTRVSYLDSTGGTAHAWSEDADGHKNTAQVGDKLTFTGKMSNFVVDYNKTSVGGDLEIKINGASNVILDTLDSSLAAGVKGLDSYTVDGLDYTTETVIELSFSGDADASTTSPEISIAGLHTDMFGKEDNGLISEFQNFTRTFDTPKSYNTTASAPYYIQLENFPVEAGSTKIDYSGTALTEVATAADITTDTEFAVDEDHGKVFFHRALTGLLVTHNITGEIYEDGAAASDFTSVGTTNLPVVKEVVGEDAVTALSASDSSYTVSLTPVTTGSFVVRFNDGSGEVTLVEDTDYTTDYPNNKIELITTSGSTSTFASDTYTQTSDHELWVDYSYDTTESVNLVKYVSQFPIDTTGVRLLDHKGTALAQVADDTSFTARGEFTVIEDASGELKEVIFTEESALSEVISNIELMYLSDERPGVPTNYNRQVVLKPKDINEYPWFSLDKGQIHFVAEFDEEVPSQNVTVREMGLFDGPRVDDKIRGYDGYPVKAFSLVRVGNTRKENTTGLRITWTITLLNENNQPFSGGTTI